MTLSLIRLMENTLDDIRPVFAVHWRFALIYFSMGTP